MPCCYCVASSFCNGPCQSSMRRSAVTRRCPSSAVATMMRSAGSPGSPLSAPARIPISPSTRSSIKPCRRFPRRVQQCVRCRQASPDLDQALPEGPATPRPDVLGESDPPLAIEHRSLPERDRRNRHIACCPSVVHSVEGLSAQLLAAASEPEQNVGVQQNQPSSQPRPLCAFHSTSMGSVMSPTISSFPLSMPNRVSGLS